MSMINALVDYLANLFKNEHGIDLRDDPSSKERLHNASEMAAIELVDKLVTTINLPYIWADSSGPKHFEHNFIRNLRVSGNLDGSVFKSSPNLDRSSYFED